jgi:hypothetical protein
VSGDADGLRLWVLLGGVVSSLVGLLLFGVRMLLKGKLIPVREHERVIAVYEERNQELIKRNAEWQTLYFAQVALNATLNGQVAEVLGGIRKAREAGEG